MSSHPRNQQPEEDDADWGGRTHVAVQAGADRTKNMSAPSQVGNRHEIQRMSQIDRTHGNRRSTTRRQEIAYWSEMPGCNSRGRKSASRSGVP